MKKRSNCPISSALDVWGDKWTLLIIRDLMFFGKTSYGDFLSSDEGIATNILADRLDLLEKTGIVIKGADSKKKSKSNYRLTKKGIDLIPVLIEIIKWSAKYGKFPEEVSAMVRMANKDRDGLINRIEASLNKVPD